MDGTILESTISPAYDWSFADLKRTETLWGPHGYHRYPAKFIPQLVRQIIELYSEYDELVGDPFLGSATTAIEALRTGRKFWGSDVNPVALLISNAKCVPIEPDTLNKVWADFNKQLEQLPHIGRRNLTDTEKEKILQLDIAHASDNERLNYWFPSSYVDVLDMLLQNILELREEKIRTFFLCAFSNILKRCSIWLSGSTKPQKDLGKALSDPREAFQLQVRDMFRRNRIYWNDLIESKISPVSLYDRYHLALEDARHLPLEDKTLDLLVSSPPYATCYEYTEIHQLTQLWFERHGVINDGKWQHTCIGSKNISIRQTPNKEYLCNTGSPAADKALNTLENLIVDVKGNPARREAMALRYYFQDMQLVVKEFARIIVPGKRMVLIVGDSRKRGIEIPTSIAVQEMAALAGFELEQRIVRKIPARILVSNRHEKTGRFSSTAQSEVLAYPEEDILIFKSAA